MSSLEMHFIMQHLLDFDNTLLNQHIASLIVVFKAVGSLWILSEPDCSHA